MKLYKYLWRVSYNCCFSSSSGMENYTIGSSSQDVHVVTETRNVDELETTLSSHQTFVSITKAEFLGEIANPIVTHEQSENE